VRLVTAHHSGYAAAFHQGVQRARRWRRRCDTGRQQSGWSFALTLGLGSALVDASPGWDDPGVSAVTLFAACFLLGVVSPRQPWLWAVAVGGWIPAFGIVLRHDAPSVGSLLALVVAVVGAYAGAGVRALMAGARSGGKYVAPCGCPAPFHYGANLLSA
jgi:hypothetical protein